MLDRVTLQIDPPLRIKTHTTVTRPRRSIGRSLFVGAGFLTLVAAIVGWVVLREPDVPSRTSFHSDSASAVVAVAAPSGDGEQDSRQPNVRDAEVTGQAASGSVGLQ